VYYVNESATRESDLVFHHYFVTLVSYSFVAGYLNSTFHVELTASYMDMVSVNLTGHNHSQSLCAIDSSGTADYARPFPLFHASLLAIAYLNTSIDAKKLAQHERHCSIA